MNDGMKNGWDFIYRLVDTIDNIRYFCRIIQVGEFGYDGEVSQVGIQSISHVGISGQNILFGFVRFVLV